MNKTLGQQNVLLDAAMKAFTKAYAPYSKFRVGAAVQTKSGNIYSGCNVENVSLGLTICAERNAVAAAVAAGEREFEAIAVVTDFADSVFPCGACRQVLAEFGAHIEVLSSTMNGKIGRALLSDLLPKAGQQILPKQQDV